MSPFPLRLLLAAAVFAAVTARTSPAQEAPTTVAEVLDAVERANPMLEAARLEGEARAQQRAQVAALPDPTVSVTYQPLPMLTAHGTQRTQWRVEQMVPYPGKLSLQGDIADLGAVVARHEADALAADLLLQAKEAYYDLYHVQRLTELVHAFQEDLRGFEDAAAARYEVGQGTQQAVLKAQVEKNQLAQRLMDLRARRRSAAMALARLTNAPDGTFETVDLAPPLRPDVPMEAMVAASVAERPEMAALDAAEARASKQIALSHKQRLPDFGVSLTYFDIASAAMPPTAGGRDALAIGASVKLPLQRGRIRSQIAESEVRARQIEARRAALETDIETDLDDLLYALEQERATLELYEQTLLPQAASTVEATLSAYTTGRTDFLNLLDAERTVFALRTGRADAFIRYLKTTARLERVLGIASLEDLDDVIATRNEETE